MKESGKTVAPLDILFLHVPKRRNYSWSIGDFSFILYPPIGLLGLADYLRQQGLSSLLIHLGVEESVDRNATVESILQRQAAPIVGLDLHWHFQAYDVIEAARRIRKAHPDVAILLGGITASLFADEILHEFPFIDFIIRGDAEVPLRELIRHHNSSREYGAVPNLAYRSGSRIVHNSIGYVADTSILESIRFTDFTLMKNYQKYIEHFSRYIRLNHSLESLQEFLFAKYSSFPVFIGRGCTFNCSYCGGSHEAHQQIGARTKTAIRSSSAVLDSIRDLAKFGFDFACLTSDCILPQDADGFYVPVFDAISRDNLPIGIEVERNFLPSTRFLHGFSKLPRRDSFITLSPHTQNEALRRDNHLYRYSNLEMEECLKAMESLGVHSRVCFTCGLPFESRGDLMEMVRYQKSLRKQFRLADIRTALIEIEPGSGMSRDPELYGIRPDRSTFLDFYRYHSQPDKNHWSALGYDRVLCPPQDEVKQFYCHHFCRRFGPGRISPIVCKTVGVFREAGFFPLFNQVLALKRDNSSPQRKRPE